MRPSRKQFRPSARTQTHKPTPIDPKVASSVNRMLQKKENLKETKSSKFFTQLVNTAAVTSTGAITDFSTAAQGVTQGQRTGDRIFPLRFEMRWSLSTPDVTNVTRVILFRYKPNSVPTIATMLENGPGGVPGPYSKFLFQNQENIDVLWDSQLIVSVSNLVAGSGNQGGTVFGNCHHRPITFNPALLTGTDKIYLLTISDSVAAPDPALTIGAYFFYHEDEL